MATNAMPAFSFRAGNGCERTSSVITGAMKDNSQATACENHSDADVPSTSLNIRRVAMSTESVVCAR